MLKIYFREYIFRINTLFFKDIKHIMYHITVTVTIAQSIGTYGIFTELLCYPSMKIATGISLGAGKVPVSVITVLLISLSCKSYSVYNPVIQMWVGTYKTVKWRYPGSACNKQKLRFLYICLI